MFSFEPCRSGDLSYLGRSFWHSENSPEQLSRKMLHLPPTEPLKLIGNYVLTKVYTVIFHQKYFAEGYSIPGHIRL